MTKILKKVQLSAEQSTPMSADPTKGTAENPYTQEERAAFPQGTWPGGFVQGVGFVPGTKGNPEPMTSPSISYPDDGTIIYPGIYVPAGSYTAQHFHFDNNRNFDSQLNLAWGSGYTGTSSFGIPNWGRSNIAHSIIFNLYPYNIDLCRKEVLGPINPNVHWKKISNGVYSIALKFKYVFNLYYITNHDPNLQDSAWELFYTGEASIDTEIPYEPDLNRGYPLIDI